KSKNDSRVNAQVRGHHGNTHTHTHTHTDTHTETYSQRWSLSVCLCVCDSWLNTHAWCGRVSRQELRRSPDLSHTHTHTQTHTLKHPPRGVVCRSACVCVTAGEIFMRGVVECEDK